MRTFKKGIQQKIVSLLAIEKEKGHSPVSIHYIKDFFGIDSIQMKHTRTKLIQKGLVVAPIREHLALVRIPRVFRYRICALLTQKDNRPYCPIKRCFFGENDVSHFCGLLKCVRFNGEQPQIYYEPHCVGWVPGRPAFVPKERTAIQRVCEVCGEPLLATDLGVCGNCFDKLQEEEILEVVRT